jgi:UDP-N-acetylglucosamine 2-epimerase
MLKVMTIVGTRPEIIRLSCTIPKLDRHFRHILVHTGQNYDYELNEIFFKELGIRAPDVFLNAARDTAAQTIGQVIQAADAAMEEHRPDAVLLLGDTNSALACIAAKRRKIPIFHMEAGNRCFDLRVPEEINRKIVDHTSDINLTYSDIARSYLLREGLPPDQIIRTGSPMTEVINHYRSAFAKSTVLKRLKLERGGYFVVSVHREENVDAPANLARFSSALVRIAETYALPVVVSTHPRTRQRLENLQPAGHELVSFHKPFGYLDYLKLQIEARVVLSDSGTITEEASILNFPALNLRDVNERPEGFEEAAVMMVGMDADRILQGIDILAGQPRGDDRLLRIVEDYKPENVSDKIVRIILSYTDFVNRRVWSK